MTIQSAYIELLNHQIYEDVLLFVMAMFRMKPWPQTYNVRAWCCHIMYLQLWLTETSYNLNRQWLVYTHTKDPIMYWSKTPSCNNISWFLPFGLSAWSLPVFFAYENQLDFNSVWKVGRLSQKGNMKSHWLCLELLFRNGYSV